MKKISLILLLIPIYIKAFKKSSDPINQNNTIEVINFESLEDLMNKKNDSLYIFNFWATWCVPCVKELPYFEEVSRNPSLKKIKIYLISLDNSDNISRVKTFSEKRKIISEIKILEAGDPNKWVPKISDEWDGAIPVTLFKYKNKTKFVNGSMTKKELNNIIKKI